MACYLYNIKINLYINLIYQI